ncbi:MAG: murein biosynthesis integral membrane protein MurJ [Oscillospiraceae bacterium]|jgi:putative peptidoglycan lipid II flippase|nr:murein biosynthesis integral membrane protein MurJ [Oscillospiraceae bacterium]
MQKTTEKNPGIGALSQSMLVVMVLTMGGKLIGFLRETVMASTFSISAATDAIKAADPTILLAIIVTALATTMIPVYADRLQKGKPEAEHFISTIFTVGLVFSAVVLLLTALFIDPIIHQFVMRGADAETQALTVRLARMMMPMGIFFFLAKVTTACLQANFNFAIPALSQMLLNLAVIVSMLLAGGSEAMAYVAIGTVIGWALQFAVQLPSMRRIKLRVRPRFDLNDPGLRSVLILMLPVLISGAFDQLYFFFDKSVASATIGHITMLDYGNKISTMVSSVLLTTIATVLYPSLVRRVGDRAAFRDNMGFGLNLNLLVAVPAVAALVQLCVPITRVVYQHGVFTAENTQATARVLACYAVGVVGFGMRELCNRAFYALKDTRVPMIAGVAAVLLNIILNYALYPIWQEIGIALATAISQTASGIALLILLRRVHGAVDWRRLLRCLLKSAIATAAMLLAMALCMRALSLQQAAGMRFYIGLFATMGLGLVVYVAALAVLKTEELRSVLSFLRAKIARKQ